MNRVPAGVGCVIARRRVRPVGNEEKGDDTMDARGGIRCDGARTAFCAAFCAISLSVMFTPTTLAASSSSGVVSAGCGTSPPWVETATLPQGGQYPLESCFSSQSSQSEAPLRIVNNRRYAQLLIVDGAELDLTESTFTGTLEGPLARLMADLSYHGDSSVFLLGPGARATLLLGHPAPGSSNAVHIVPATSNAFAVGALAWRLLSEASSQRSLPTATASCVLAAVYGALSSPPEPEEALWRMHSCVDTAAVSRPHKRLLRRLASALLRDSFFKAVIHREGTEPIRPGSS